MATIKKTYFFLLYVAVPHPCIDQPCRNGGTCIDTYFNDNAGREQYNGHDIVTPSINQEFFCLCPLGFSGPRCGGKYLNFLPLSSGGMVDLNLNYS